MASATIYHVPGYHLSIPPRTRIPAICTLVFKIHRFSFPYGPIFANIPLAALIRFAHIRYFIQSAAVFAFLRFPHCFGIRIITTMRTFHCTTCNIHHYILPLVILVCLGHCHCIPNCLAHRIPHSYLGIGLRPSPWQSLRNHLCIVSANNRTV